MRIIDSKLKHHVWRYVFQCALAALSVLIVLIFLDVFCHSAIIATLGASAFIVFTMPRSYPSRPRPLIGGYVIGIIVGIISYYISNSSLMLTLFGNLRISYVVFGAIAVGAAILLMTITDTEHAPAAGIPIALVFNKWDYSTVLFILSIVIVLFLVKSLLKPILVDLR
ncbi:MAG: HPP family protein [Candidatus Stahlbacteria bacterium]|nr:MAG: HPP family protein [Candidatus Stahlbacteria bacterium]